MIRVLIAMMLVACGLPTWADAVTPAQRLLRGLPEAVVLGIQIAPTAAMEDAAALIFAFGGPRGIDSAGLGASIAMERAEVRVRELRKLLVADLDDDGVVTGAEVAAVGNATSPRVHARMVVALRFADTDADGRADAGEQRAQATRAALRLVSQQEADERTALMLFDLDEDGFVNLDEVRRGMTLLLQSGAASGVSGQGMHLGRSSEGDAAL